MENNGTTVVRVWEKKGSQARYILVSRALTNGEEVAITARRYLAALQRRVAAVARKVAAVTAMRLEFSSDRFDFCDSFDAAPMSRGRRGIAIWGRSPRL